jgi:hypothetical protein
MDIKDLGEALEKQRQELEAAFQRVVDDAVKRLEPLRKELISRPASQCPSTNRFKYTGCAENDPRAFQTPKHGRLDPFTNCVCRKTLIRGRLFEKSNTKTLKHRKTISKGYFTRASIGTTSPRFRPSRTSLTCRSHFSKATRFSPS